MRKWGSGRDDDLGDAGGSDLVPGRRTLTGRGPAMKSETPGKRSVSEGLVMPAECAPMVQRKASGGEVSADPVGTATRGVSGRGGALPHLDVIQKSFGRHDVSGVAAHQDAAAAGASRDLGARGYAMGNAVAFDGAPDLHTAAHEAAHVVQQRGDLALKAVDGGASDASERHADAVAEAVVSGKSAEALLSAGPGAGATVQRTGGGAKPVVRAPSGASGALMLRITPEWAAQIAAESKGGAGRDVELKDILLGAFEANWFKAKDCLLFDRWPVPKTAPDRPTHAAQGDLMQALVNMRSRVCDAIAALTQEELPAKLKEVASEAKADAKRAPVGPAPAQVGIEQVADQFSAEVDDPSISPAQHTSFFTPLGAQKKTSDIDVSTGGKNTEIAVKLFNEIFRRELRVPFDPATVFDYNVYSSDWIHRANFKNENMVTATEIDPATKVAKVGAAPKQVPTRITPGPEHVISGGADDAGANAALQKDRAEILDETALLHIRRNCTAPDWKIYAKGRLDKIPAEAEKRLLQTKLAAVDIKYKQFAAEVEARASTVEAQMSATLTEFDRVSDWGAKNKEFQHEAVHTRASNELYQEKLRTVKALRLQYAAIAAKSVKTEEDIQALARIAKDVTKALGDAFFFANEVYASEGAVLHTVVGIQMATGDAKKFGLPKIDVVLTKDHYMQSFHENVGDSLHQIGHYEQDPPYAIYRAGKYIDRMIQAADALCGKDEAIKHPKYIALAELATKATTVKGTDAGDDPVEIAKQFPEANKGALSTLKQAILVFGGDIPSLSQEVEQKKAARTAKPATPAQAAPAEAAPTFQTSNPVMGGVKSKIESLRASVEASDDKGKT